MALRSSYNEFLQDIGSTYVHMYVHVHVPTYITCSVTIKVMESLLAPRLLWNHALK